MNTFHASHCTYTLVLHVMDLITETAIQIEESIKETTDDFVLEPQERDFFWMKLPVLDALGKLDLFHQGPIFGPVELV